MNRQFEVKHIKKYFKEKGCVLLENEYINCSTKMKYICICGNQSNICLNSFKNGHRCGCARKTINKLSQDKIRKEIEVKGYQFVSCEQHRNTYRIVSICKKCNTKRKCELGNFRKNGCRNCYNKKIKKILLRKNMI